MEMSLGKPALNTKFDTKFVIRSGYGYVFIRDFVCQLVERVSMSLRQLALSLAMTGADNLSDSGFEEGDEFEESNLLNDNELLDSDDEDEMDDDHDESADEIDDDDREMDEAAGVGAHDDFDNSFDDDLLEEEDGGFHKVETEHKEKMDDTQYENIGEFVDDRANMEDENDYFYGEYEE